MKRRMTFENFDTKGGVYATQRDRESLASAKTAAQTFAAYPQKWLVFFGPRGCGKTHLAVAIGGESQRQGPPGFLFFCAVFAGPPEGGLRSRQPHWPMMNCSNR